MTGNSIYNLIDLDQAVKKKQSVVVPNSLACAKPCPAAFLMNVQGGTLLKLFKMGMYIYKPLKKEERSW